MTALLGPYAAAVHAYRDAGWPGVLPLPVLAKSPPPEDYTGHTGRWPSDADLALWEQQMGEGNVGLRVPPGVIGIDVDHYDDKRGADVLADLEAQWGALPETWISTSRPAPSGIRLFSVPVGVQFTTVIPGGIEIVQHHHRYLVAWPSVHPDHGGIYQWIDPEGDLAGRPPGLDELPSLPERWVEGLTNPWQHTGKVVDNGPVAEHRETAWSKAVLDALTRVNIAEPGGRHDGATAGAMALARLEQLDHPGATAALEVLGQRFIAAVTAPGANQRSQRSAETEWAGRGGILPSARERARTTPPVAEPYYDMTGLWAYVAAEHARAMALGTSTDKAAPEATPGRFRIWTMAELNQSDLTLRWSVRGVLADPTYGMIAGELKTLKSYVSALLAASVASGQPLFDRFTVDRPGPVLTYVGEGGRIPWTRRMQRIARAIGVGDSSAMPMGATFDVAPIDSPKFQESYLEQLAEWRPALFLLDPYYAYHGSSVEASNLHQEGGLLASLSAPADASGTNLLVVNHFNQTGSGSGLKRITQSGSGEWVDSWLLLSHREVPEVAAGRFHLSLEIGSRQWGGSSWDLDLCIGRFDPDTGTHDGEITWDLRIAKDPSESPQSAALELVRAQPGRTKEEIAKTIGGRLADARRFVEQMDEAGTLARRLVKVTRSDGRGTSKWLYFAPEAEEGGTSDETDISLLRPAPGPWDVGPEKT